MRVDGGESRRTHEQTVEGPQRGTRPTEPTKTYVIDQKFSQQCCYCEDGDGCNKISYILEQDGPGIMSGANYGPRYAIFEAATRNTGTKLAGTNSANPCAMINASADLLGHLGFNQHCNVIRDAILKTINEDVVHTTDLSGQATTSEL